MLKSRDCFLCARFLGELNRLQKKIFFKSKIDDVLRPMIALRDSAKGRLQRLKASYADYKEKAMTAHKSIATLKHDERRDKAKIKPLLEENLSLALRAIRYGLPRKQKKKLLTISSKSESISFNP
jgi:hypothetical protein